MSRPGAEANSARAAEAVRRLNHATIAYAADELTAPRVYRIVADLKRAAYGLEQSVDQLAAVLRHRASLGVLYDDHGGDPAVTVAEAVAELGVAGERAGDLGRALDLVHNAVGRLGEES